MSTDYMVQLMSFDCAASRIVGFLVDKGGVDSLAGLSSTCQALSTLMKPHRRLRLSSAASQKYLSDPDMVSKLNTLVMDPAEQIVIRLDSDWDGSGLGEVFGVALYLYKPGFSLWSVLAESSVKEIELK